MKLIIFTVILLTLYSAGIFSQTPKCIPSVDTLDGLIVNSNPDDFPDSFIEEIFKHISNCIKYPITQYSDNPQTIVYITFIIDLMGMVRNPCIYKPFTGNELNVLEKNAINCVSEIPPLKVTKITSPVFPFRLRMPLRLEWK
jgi:hypothetical protein